MYLGPIATYLVLPIHPSIHLVSFSITAFMVLHPFQLVSGRIQRFRVLQLALMANGAMQCNARIEPTLYYLSPFLSTLSISDGGIGQWERVV